MKNQHKKKHNLNKCNKGRIFTIVPPLTLKGDEVGRKKLKVEGKKGGYTGANIDAACSAGPCSSGDEQRRESREVLVRGRRVSGGRRRK